MLLDPVVSRDVGGGSRGYGGVICRYEIGELLWEGM